MRKRQGNIDIKESEKQKQNKISEANSKIPGMGNIPVTYFEVNTIGKSILGTALLKPRPPVTQSYTELPTPTGIPNISQPLTYDYFFIEYNNMNTVGIGSLLKSFSVIKTLSPLSLSEISFMLGMQAKTITPLSKDEYIYSSFNHPTYINDNGTPLSFRYSEIPLLLQRTPGRLDNVPLGYPAFDNTPDGVTTSIGPLPSAPYADFLENGVTSSVTISAGGTVYFKDNSPNSPQQIGPTGWYWDFGSTGASPTGATAQNVLVTYGITGTFTVTMTASNSTGSSTKTKTNIITVN